jgi:molecular chaperone DnaK
MIPTTNQNILIGIDLGTANSKIAVNIDGKIEMVKRPGGVEYTPSVFGFDKYVNKVVGQKAYDHLYKLNEKEDSKNFKAEVKRLMGTSETTYFPRAKSKMNPEEISAEILKDLKEQLLRKYPDFDTSSVVITVPAAFTALHSEATKRAGNLAGFRYVVLLQEPIAAAISYGFMNARDENWLIYDFGGGTFDLALVSCKDGVLSVLGQGGEGRLGGKDIDWNIVKNIIVPKILEKYKFTDFNKKNLKYESIFARLKYSAELAKIELSQDPKTLIVVDDIGKDEAGKEVNLSIPFSRNEFNKLIEPTIDQTIELAKETIEESGLKSSSVKRIILVGGTTLIPFIKQKLEDTLKIKVDSSVDPLTVVANGACIFAIGQKIPKEFLQATPKKAGIHSIDLHYASLTSDTEESVTGSIDGLDDKGEYSLQMQSESGTFTGPKIKINKGKFYYTVKVQKNRQNMYWMYLFDNKSNPIKIFPESFTITHGISVSGIPLPHSIRIVVAKTNLMGNDCDLVFEKGAILPLKKSLEGYKTSRKLKKGEDGSLDIRIVSGESTQEDRNDYLFKVGIPGKTLEHDLPERTPVELTVEINESSELSLTGYIPLYDIPFDGRITIRDEDIKIDDIATKLEVQKMRAGNVFEHCSDEERKKISNSIQSTSESLTNSERDEDEKRKANKQLKTLMILLDEVEEEKKMPQLIKEYNLQIEQVQKLINEYADPKQKDEFNKQLDAIKADGGTAIKENNKTLLSRTNEQLQNLGAKAAYSNPNTWITYFKQIAQGGSFTNEKEAQYYINKGMQAINSRDYEELKRCAVQLNLLRPIEKQKEINLSGITH